MTLDSFIRDANLTELQWLIAYSCTKSTSNKNAGTSPYDICSVETTYTELKSKQARFVIFLILEDRSARYFLFCMMSLYLDFLIIIWIFLVGWCQYFYLNTWKFTLGYFAFCINLSVDISSVIYRLHIFWSHFFVLFYLVVWFLVCNIHSHELNQLEHGTFSILRYLGFYRYSGLLIWHHNPNTTGLRPSRPAGQSFVKK
jgi:hypothetical protein